MWRSGVIIFKRQEAYMRETDFNPQGLHTELSVNLSATFSQYDDDTLFTLWACEKEPVDICKRTIDKKRLPA